MKSFFATQFPKTLKTKVFSSHVERNQGEVARVVKMNVPDAGCILKTFQGLLKK